MSPQPTKVCARCKERKPWSEYHAKTKWPDGTMRTPQGYCKACRRVAVSEWRAANPERNREHERRAWQALRSDPERLATRREYNRQQMRRARGYKTERTQHRSPVGQSPTLDAAPFAAWLRTLGDTPGEIATVTGLNQRKVFGLLRGEMTRIRLDTVDAACCRAGAHIDDLYPYDESATAA